MRAIPDEYKAIVDPAVGAIVDSMREIACDYPEAEDEQVLQYALLKLLNTVYSSGKASDLTSALGVLEAVKMDYFRIQSVMTSGLPSGE